VEIDNEWASLLGDILEKGDSFSVSEVFSCRKCVSIKQNGSATPSQIIIQNTQIKLRRKAINYITIHEIKMSKLKD
jgi:hypothetical protein